jgi:hypothetical protein
VLSLGLRVAALCVALLLSIVSAPSAASATNLFTGGQKGLYPPTPWRTWGSEQQIETRSPYDQGFDAAFASEVDDTAGVRIVQIGYTGDWTVFYQAHYFYEFEDDAHYSTGCVYILSPVPVEGSMHTYTIYKDFARNWWIGKIDGVERVHTGADHISWTPNGVQNWGETYLDADLFVGQVSNHCLFSGNRWMDQYSGWHGGVLNQWHNTPYGKNDIGVPTGTYTIWDLRAP